MGWLYGWDGREQLIQHLTSPDEAGTGQRAGCRWVTVAHALRGNTLWAVHCLESPDGEPAGDACICCYLLQVHGDWGYKPIDESCGPCYYTCPLKYLDMAPEKNPQWRQQVRDYHAKARRKLGVGQWYEYSGERVACISRLSPLCGWVGGTEYRLRKKDVGECLTA